MQNDLKGAMSIAGWTATIISIIVLFIIAAALFPTYRNALTDLDNATTNPLGPVVVTLGVVLLLVGLVLALVYWLLPSRGVGR